VRALLEILLKNPPFILREPQDERRAFEIIGDFSGHAEPVEAFLGFFSRICLTRLTLTSILSQRERM
jgi:hypothetical protein